MDKNEIIDQNLPLFHSITREKFLEILVGRLKVNVF